MSQSHIPFWIASDLLAQAQAYGIELPSEFSQQLRGIVQGEQRSWMTEKREVDDHNRRVRRKPSNPDWK